MRAQTRAGMYPSFILSLSAACLVVNVIVLPSVLGLRLLSLREGVVEIGWKSVAPPQSDRLEN